MNILYVFKTVGKCQNSSCLKEASNKDYVSANQ